MRVRITSFGTWLGDNNLFEDFIYGSPETKKRLKEQYKKELEK